jgi:hypothetical protein
MSRALTRETPKLWLWGSAISERGWGASDVSDTPTTPTTDAEAFLAFMEERLDVAEGKTTDRQAIMQIACVEFGLNGRRLIAMARAGLESTK